jgi:hypothetical protein
VQTQNLPTVVGRKGETYVIITEVNFYDKESLVATSRRE